MRESLKSKLRSVNGGQINWQNKIQRQTVGALFLNERKLDGFMSYAESRLTPTNSKQLLDECPVLVERLIKRGFISKPACAKIEMADYKGRRALVIELLSIRRMTSCEILLEATLRGMPLDRRIIQIALQGTLFRRDDEGRWFIGSN